MKKLLPYILSAVALVALITLMVLSPAQNKRKFDERITLRQKDKIPYGTFVAKNLLSPLFPNASIGDDRNEPDKWNYVSSTSSNQVVFLIANSFEPEEYELKKITDFIHQGNYVFLIAKTLSYEAIEYFNMSDTEGPSYLALEDSLQVSLKNPLFASTNSFIYPGKKYDSYFSTIDTAKALPLGTDNKGNINFIQMQTGKGKLFIHLAPLAFSNYFILHKKNIHYFQKAVSIIPSNVNKVLWNEYYLTKQKVQDEKEPGVLRILWQYPSFRWALIIAIATILLFALLEMRRRQRIIPVWTKSANDSLDFVKTMGRLYYDRNDHHNLSKKLATYFLDHVRMRYKIPTHILDQSFVQQLHAKSGYPENELNQIVSFINYINDSSTISEHQLSDFYKQLESFYQNS